MAAYKNQHFVPRCYLKSFSIDGYGRSINCFNVSKKKSINNASVKKQCARSYFYGENPRIEELLSSYEGSYAAVARRAQHNGYKLTSEDCSTLRRFSYLQYCRTEAAAVRAKLAWEEMEELSNVRADIDIKMSMRAAVLDGIRNFSGTMTAVDDLKVCLIRNETRVKLVCSDNPAVITNRWYLQDRRAKHFGMGVASAGTLLLLPISPVPMCVIYDGDIYSIPNEFGISSLKKTQDSHAFNQLQILYCFENVYFSDWADAENVRRNVEEVLSLRPHSRHEIVTAKLDRTNESGSNYVSITRAEMERAGQFLIHLRHIDPKPRLWPSILKWRYNKKVYSNGTGTGFVRQSMASDPSARPYRLIK